MTQPRVRPIPPEYLAGLRGAGRDDDGNPLRPFVDEEGGAPLRCCLRDSGPGERIALISYRPVRRSVTDLGRAADAGAAPYDEAGPVFVHAQSCDGPNGDRYPEQLRRRQLVLRCYGTDGRILGGTVAPPGDGQPNALAELLADPAVAFVHARTVVHGCFLADVRRG